MKPAELALGLLVSVVTPHRHVMDQELAKEVLRYFLRHPDAADDVEGVARWRLLEATIHRSVEETTQVMAWLVSKRFLTERSTPGSGSIFQLNREKRTEIERFLRQRGSARTRSR